MADTNRDICIEDAALAVRARNGDMTSFEMLTRKYRNDVYAICFYFTRNREDAWDAAQETFIKAFRALSRYRGDASFKTWLLRIAANQCKDQLKRRRLTTVSYDDDLRANEYSSGSTPSSEAQVRELGRAIETAVEQLPHKQKLAFILREYEGLSYQEMAKVMQCGVGTVMSRLFHARRKLQESLMAMGLMEDIQ